MKKAAKPLYDPAAVRGRGPVPTYIWTGYEKHSKAYHRYRAHGTPPNWHVFYTLSGTAFFGQGGARQLVQRGDLVLLAPDCEHDYGCHAQGKWECLFAHFTPRPHWLELMGWPVLVPPGVRRLHLPDTRVRSAVAAALSRCNAYRQAAFSHYAYELAMAALEEVLLLAAHEQSYSGTQAQLSPAIRGVITHIAQNLTRPLSVPALARIARLSPSRFSHRFKEETGEPVISYIIRLRIQRAAALLEFERKSVKETAAACGFSSEFYFSRQFRRWYLLSPSAYKQSVAKMGAQAKA